ncbi:MAG: dockerin type I repeat-containing protein, partial [Bacteroidaceae bacterium]|nr:dockerin type I repeat-containing protein [Bacteroidaceae bacterium]
MKKFYLFLAAVFAMLCTVSVDAQKYSLLEEATTPEVGVSYVIMNASTNQYISCKYGGNGGLLEVMDDDDVLWQLEATGEQTDAGYDLWYLYSVGAGKYVQEVDLEGNEGLDGYDVYSYNGFNWELGDKATAMKVVIERGVPGDDQLDDEVWRKNGPSTGFVISRQNIVYWGESPKMMKFGRQGNNVAWEPYNEDVAWQFWTVKENPPQEQLEALVDEYSKVEFVGGTDPGFYRQAEADAYTESLESAMMLVVTGATDDEFRAAVADLRAKRAAVEKVMIPLTEGYYFIVSAFDDYLNEFGHEKGVWDDTVKNLISSKNFDPEDVVFVWYVSPNTNSDAEANEFWVQNYVSGHYVGHGANWYSSTTPLTPDPSEPQNIRQFVSGKWYWGNRTYHNTSYCVQESWSTDHPEAKDIEDALSSFGQWGDDSTKHSHFNLWYFRSVSDEQMVDFAEKKAQADRTAQIKDLANQANDIYGKLFTYKSGDEGLITVAGGNWGLDMGGENTNVEGNQIAFYHIRGQGVAGSDDYQFLIDEHDSTYMQGSGYIDIDITANPQQIVTFTYTTRCASMEHGTANQHQWGVQERPNMVEIYASNDTVDNNWTLVGSTSLGTVTPAEKTNPFPPVSFTIDLGETYGYLRYKVLTNANNGSYFTLSGFQVYPSVVDEATSQYYTTEGMKDKADALMALVAEKSAIAETATEDDVIELKNAFNAVQELYADTTALAELADECLVLATTAVEGDDIGMLTDGALAETLETVAATARRMISPTISVDEVKAQMAALRTAKENFLNGLNNFEPNTIYYLENASIDAACGDRMLYASAPDRKTVLRAGVVGETYDEYSAETMWMFVPAEGEGLYYVQNVATGFYATEFNALDGDAPLSFKAVPYEVKYTGYGSYSLIPANSTNKDGAALALKEAEGKDPSATFAPVEAMTSTSWNIKPLAEDVEGISTSFITLYNAGVLALPYNLSQVADLNDGIKLYKVKSMTEETTDEGELRTTIEFYEVDEVAANEPVYYEYTGPEGAQLTVPLPTELSAVKVPANGLVGLPYAQTVGAGVAYGSPDGLTTSTTNVNLAAQTGYIDPAKYTGEVADVTRDSYSTFYGLNPLPSSDPADVNGDGNKNTADVVAVYTFIEKGEGSGFTREAADVNRDNNVNTADVVAIYTAIIGGSGSNGFVKSGAFYPGAETIDGSDNVLTILVESTDDLSKIPVTLYLSNPTNEITAVEATLVAPV